MEYQQLGRSSLNISRIGFGCMSLKQNGDTEKIIHHAVDMGINFFDTADLYDKGNNETMVGKALKNKRNQVMLATKGGNQWREDGSGWDWNPDPAYLVTAVENSLRRLKTDYIDLYQLHGGTIADRADAIIDTFETLVKQGKIRYYGISSIRPNVIRNWLQHSGMVSVMMQYSLLDRRPEEEALSLLSGHHVGVLARGSLAQGLLTGKPSVPYLDHSANEVNAAAEAIRNVTNGFPAAAVAIAYVLANPAITSVVAGIRTREQLEDALKAVNGFSLGKDDYVHLQNSIGVKTYKDHR